MLSFITTSCKFQKFQQYAIFTRRICNEKYGEKVHRTIIDTVFESTIIVVFTCADRNSYSLNEEKEVSILHAESQQRTNEITGQLHYRAADTWSFNKTQPFTISVLYLLIIFYQRLGRVRGVERIDSRNLQVFRSLDPASKLIRFCRDGITLTGNNDRRDTLTLRRVFRLEMDLKEENWRKVCLCKCEYNYRCFFYQSLR